MESFTVKPLFVERVSKNYGSVPIIRNVSFDVEPGEIVGLIGANGVGKTTLLMMILGLLQPTSGNIRIFGKDLKTQKSQTLSRLNFVASYAELPGNLTVEENLRIYGLLYKIPELSARIRQLLDEFRLNNLKSKKTGLLSSGEKARVLLAKALLNKPELVLLDEPTASLDPHSSVTICSWIQNYAKSQKCAVLWTSHDMQEIETICHRVLLLSDGRLLLSGRPQDLADQFHTKNLEELLIKINQEPDVFAKAGTDDLHP